MTFSHLPDSLCDLIGEVSLAQSLSESEGSKTLLALTLGTGTTHEGRGESGVSMLPRLLRREGRKSLGCGICGASGVTMEPVV